MLVWYQRDHADFRNGSIFVICSFTGAAFARNQTLQAFIRNYMLEDVARPNSASLLALASLSLSRPPISPASQTVIPRFNALPLRARHIDLLLSGAQLNRWGTQCSLAVGST